MNIWQLLTTNTPCCLLVVVDHTPGSPGRQGFKMVVAADGTTAGTIGGGPMEHRLLQQARLLISSPGSLPQLVEQVHNPTAPANRSGMICSGSQTVVLCPVYGAVRPSGSLCITPDGLSFLPETAFSPTVFERSPAWRYQESLCAEHQLYVVGGGHVGLALCRAVQPLDFHVTLFDHRPDVHTVKLNEYAHQTIITPMDELAKYVGTVGRRYGVVVTTNVKTDEQALRALIGLHWDYLGVMGSSAKIAHLFVQLRAAGVAESALQRIRAPIGIPIDSQTPAEIAISIAAELVREKRLLTALGLSMKRP